MLIGIYATVYAVHFVSHSLEVLSVHHWLVIDDSVTIVVAESSCHILDMICHAQNPLQTGRRSCMRRRLAACFSDAGNDVTLFGIMSCLCSKICKKHDEN